MADAGIVDAGLDGGCSLSVVLPSAPLPDCVPVELAYLCAGSPTAAAVSLQSSYTSMPTVGQGTFFASPNCTGSPVGSVASPATISFRPALANTRPLVGDWLLTASTNGVSTPTLLVLAAQVTAPVTRLQVGVCTPLALPSFTGFMTSTPVAYWQDLVFDGFTLPMMFSFCGPSAVTIRAANMAVPSVPSVVPGRFFPGTITLMGSPQAGALNVTATFNVTTCIADAGSAVAAADCCNSPTTAADGGIICQ